MNDYIDRQAAIRWVKTECNPYGKPTLEFESGKKVIEHLEQMPSAQHEPIKINIDDFNKEDLERFKKELRNTPITVLPAQPEIIRCKDCKFASGDSRICMKFGHSPIGELDFCAWAERRTDE